MTALDRSFACCRRSGSYGRSPGKRQNRKLQLVGGTWRFWDASLHDSRFFSPAIRGEKQLLFEHIERVGHHIRVENLRLQTCEELFLERAPCDQERIRTHTSTAVVMQGTAVADVLPLTRTTGNDRNACVRDHIQVSNPRGM